MQSIFYLFVFDDNTYYEIERAVSFKEAVWEMAEYTGSECDLLMKSLKGFEESDINGIISLFNMFATCEVSKVYEISKIVYS